MTTIREGQRVKVLAKGKYHGQTGIVREVLRPVVQYWVELPREGGLRVLETFEGDDVTAVEDEDAGS